MGQDKIWLHCIASMPVQVASSCLYLAGVGFYMLAYELIERLNAIDRKTVRLITHNLLKFGLHIAHFHKHLYALL